MEYIYAALLLHKLGKPVDEEGMKKVIEATGAQVDDGKLKSVIASLKDVDIDKELETAVMPVVGGGAGSSEGETGEAKTKEKPKEEKKEEAAEGLSALFG